MSNAMFTLYEKSESDLNTIKEDFKKAMKLSFEIFGREAFRKVHYNYTKLPPINKAYFDAISTQFAKLHTKNIDILLRRKEDFKKLLSNQLNNDGEFYLSITSSTGDSKRIKKRHSVIAELIEKTISNHDK